MRRVGVVLFSFFFWTFGAVWLTLSVLTIRAALFFLPFPDTFIRVAKPLLRIPILLVTRGKLSVDYAPGFNPAIPSMYCFNHTNILDGLLAACVVPQAFSGVMEAWQMRIPVYGKLLCWSGGIPVSPATHPRRLIRSLCDAAKLRREDGISLVVFPEAHRTLDGKVRPFEFGVFHMAREAGYPVVPVAVRGMFSINRKGSRLFKPGPVQVLVGPQISSACSSSGELRALGEQVRCYIVDFVEKRPGAAAL